MKDGDLAKATLHTADQKPINIYSLPGVGQFPYTTLDSPKPLFPGNTSIAIKRIAPLLLYSTISAWLLPVAMFSVAITINSESAAQPGLFVL